MEKRKIRLGFPIIDLHCHLRTEIPEHTKIAKESGIDALVYMANQNPPLDNLEIIKDSVAKKRHCHAYPVSAITKGLAGEKLVDVHKIRNYVIGFSDDGKCLKNLDLFAEILKTGVLVMTHCEPETEYIKLYLEILEKTGGKLHIQHVSLKESVKLIEDFKWKNGHNFRNKKLQLTAETCPHYFTFTKDELETKVNPPLANKEDVRAIRKALQNGTIDVISSDYAPIPRITGIAGFRSFLPLCCGLVLSSVLNEQQLKKLLFINPMTIINNSGYFGMSVETKLTNIFKKKLPKEH